MIRDNRNALTWLVVFSEKLRIFLTAQTSLRLASSHPPDVSECAPKHVDYPELQSIVLQRRMDRAMLSAKNQALSRCFFALSKLPKCSSTYPLWACNHAKV